MKNAVSFLGLLTIFSCVSYPPPKVEFCIIGEDKLICQDDRVEPNEYTITFDRALNYVCTNPDDFLRLQEDRLDLIRQIEQEAFSMNGEEAYGR